jgi:hypothetical protein
MTEEGRGPGKPVLVVEAAGQESKGQKVTRPPSSGHMTQDPWDPSQCSQDMT